MDAADKIQHQINWTVIKAMTVSDYAKSKSKITQEKIKQLTINMHKAAKREDYERAAELRDKIKELKQI